jgi:hypothetical protein
MAFIGTNAKDEDNGFDLKITNEIYEDQDHKFKSLDGANFASIQQSAARRDNVAKQAVKMLLKYEITFVLLSDVSKSEEFNLQFTRLNLGTIINAGEKLHAMVGEMRNTCFDGERIGRHVFLDMVNIPTRRYAKEQVAAQILAQVFSWKTTEEFTRARHFDLQKFLKRHAAVSSEEKKWINEVERTFDSLARELSIEPSNDELLRNRAIAVTAVLVAWKRELYKNQKELKAYVTFLREFICRLRWQVGKGLETDIEYRFLINFQRHVTQASVEKPAVESRFETMEAEFNRWLESQRISGDAEYKRRTRKNPSEACRDKS